MTLRLKENIAVAVLFTLFYAVLVVFVEKNGGIGISSDSMYLLTAACQLAARQQFFTWQGEPIAAWTPFYSALIAFFYFTFNSFTQSAIAVNILAVFLANMFFVNWLKYFKMPIHLTIIWTLLFNTSVPFFFSFLFAWSDLICFAFLVAAYYVCFLYLRQQVNEKMLVLVMSLLLFSRYAAVLNAALLWLYVWYFSKEKKKIIVMAFTSTLPLLLWFLRNYYVTKTLSGNRLFLPLTWQQTAVDILQHISAWWLPTAFPFTLRVFLVILFFVFFFVTAYRYDNNIAIYFQLLGASIVATWLFYVLILTESVGERLLLPLFVFMIIPMVFAHQVIQKKGKEYEKWLSYGVAIIFLIRTSYGIVQHLRFIEQNTVHAYHDARWASNFLTEYAKNYNFEPDAIIFSNNPEKLIIQSNIAANYYADFSQKGYYIFFDTLPILPQQAIILQQKKTGIMLKIE